MTNTGLRIYGLEISHSILCLLSASSINLFLLSEVLANMNEEECRISVDEFSLHVHQTKFSKLSLISLSMV